MQSEFYCQTCAKTINQVPTLVDHGVYKHGEAKKPIGAAEDTTDNFEADTENESIKAEAGDAECRCQERCQSSLECPQWKPP